MTWYNYASIIQLNNTGQDKEYPRDESTDKVQLNFTGKQGKQKVRLNFLLENKEESKLMHFEK